MTFINERTYAPVETPAKVAFLGLGVMGYPMAGHLAKAGHQVSVFNRTAAKAAAWQTDAQEAGCDAGHLSAGNTPREAAQGAQIVMACVGNDDDLRAICLGADGAFAGMAAGSIFVDHTTASAEVARELYQACETIGHRLHRCAGLWGASWRAKRCAHGHVRWGCRGI